MIKWLLVAFLVIAGTIAGVFTGFEVGADNSPGLVDFHVAEKFMEIVWEEIRTYRQGHESIGLMWGLYTSWQGPMIIIHDDKPDMQLFKIQIPTQFIIAMAYESDGEISFREGWDAVRPFAAKIAKEIFDNQIWNEGH